MALTLRKIARTYGNCLRAARRYETSLPKVLRRFLWLYGFE